VCACSDDDVLDTWFSSGLFPFSVFGWPSQTDDLARFYPTSVLETGWDILFFWVARMVMMGQRLTKQLVRVCVRVRRWQRDDAACLAVQARAAARDGQRRAQSQDVEDARQRRRSCRRDQRHHTRRATQAGAPWFACVRVRVDRGACVRAQLRVGNLAADEIVKAEAGQKQMFPAGIPQCGTDALRFGLCSYMQQGRSICLDINRLVSYRHFCNKLWNATKFALAQLGDNDARAFVPLSHADIAAIDTRTLSVLQRWMLSRVSAGIVECERGLEQFMLVCCARNARA
jgi:valyl-tRNA synthetase